MSSSIHLAFADKADAGFINQESFGDYIRRILTVYDAPLFKWKEIERLAFGDLGVKSMLWTVIVILVVLWLHGFSVFHVAWASSTFF